jgi:iron complex transport system ATP-binding protein
MAGVLECTDISVRRDGRAILSDISWSVGSRDHWVVLGRNGSGKSTLTRISSGYGFPTTGSVHVLGHTLGRVDVHRLRTQIGFLSADQYDLIPPTESVLDAVITGSRGTFGRSHETFTTEEVSRAHHIMKQWGVADRADQALGWI